MKPRLRLMARRGFLCSITFRSRIADAVGARPCSGAIRREGHQGQPHRATERWGDGGLELTKTARPIPPPRRMPMTRIPCATRAAMKACCAGTFRIREANGKAQSTLGVPLSGESRNPEFRWKAALQDSGFRQCAGGAGPGPFPLPGLPRRREPISGRCLWNNRQEMGPCLRRGPAERGTVERLPPPRTLIS